MRSDTALCLAPAVALAVILTSGCTAVTHPTPSAFAAETDRVHAVLRALIEADNRGDADAVVLNYTDDVALIPPRGVPIAGSTAVHEHYRKLFERERLKVVLHLGETLLSHDSAVVRGRTSGKRISRADNTATRFDDEFEATVMRGGDQRWRIQRLRWW